MSDQLRTQAHYRDGSLAGRTAFVTGAASGIGRATAEALRREGARLILVDRDESGLHQWVQQSEVHLLVVDLSDRAAVLKSAADAIALDWGIDILVNAAGITGKSFPLLDTTDEDWELVHAVDSTAPFLLIREFGRHMVERGTGGRIVNITSSSAHRAIDEDRRGGTGRARHQRERHCPGLTRTPIVDRAFTSEELAQALTSGPLANLPQRI